MKGIAIVFVLLIFALIVSAQGTTKNFTENVSGACPPEPYQVNPSTCQPIIPNPPNCGTNAVQVYNATTDSWSCQSTG